MRAVLILLVLLASCKPVKDTPEAARASYDPAVVADAERHAETLTGFIKNGSPAQFSRYSASYPGKGKINGEPVFCARFAPGMRPGRGEGYDRVLIYKGQQIADAPSHERRFRVLWDISGC